MSSTVVLGGALAIGSAVITSLGFLWRHRGATSAPAVDVRRPWCSAVALFRQKWWTIGFVLAAAAWGLHVAALGFAPLSIVQATLASSLIFLAVLADRAFGMPVGRRQWTGLVLAAAGLAVIAVTSAGHSSRQVDFGLAAIIAFQAGLIGCAAALLLVAVRGAGDRGRTALVLGTAAGLLFTVTHVGIKAGTGAVAFGPGLDVDITKPVGIISPLGGLVLAGAVAAFFASARSLQLGEAVSVIAVTSIAGNASAIAAGIVVFGDPLGRNAGEIAARVGAFAVVVVAAALVPAPLGAAERQGSGLRPRATTPSSAPPPPAPARR